MSKEISRRIKVIVRNRGMRYEEIGKRLGMSRQGVSWVLNHREDKDWVEKEVMVWGIALGVDREKIEGKKSEGVERR